MHPGPRRLDPTEADGGKPVRKPTVPLRVRALQLLKRRDYSYAELERRLAPYAADASELSTLLDELQALGWLSQQRLAEALVRKGASRYGTRRILEQLQERGIGREVTDRLRSELQASELMRAQVVWTKHFGSLPTDLRERARQERFLEQRGFDPEVIHRVLRGAGEE
jgi:regulatory protein